MADKISLSGDEIREIARHHIAFHDVPLDRVSAVLIVQLLQLEAGRFIYIDEVTREIRSIEMGDKRSHTKNVDAFKRHKNLKGLKKKHFTCAAFILQNIGAHWGLANVGNSKLDKLLEPIATIGDDQEEADRFFSKLAHQLTIEAHDERFAENKVTGEWIIFDDRSGRNYYLTLARHSEPDDMIWERAKLAMEFDFPWLLPEP